MDQVKGRVFLVGCSRSGTTVLQSHLGAHPEIWTFPESDFFRKLLGRKNHRLRERLGLVDPRRVRHAFENLNKVVPGFRDMPPLPVCRERVAVDRFVREIDQLALAQSKTVWLEKTPKHFYNIKHIGRYIPGVRIIHLVRKGEDVVASMVDRAQRYPDAFGYQRDPRVAIDRWNDAVRVALACVGKPSHRVISFERFLAEPEETTTEILDFIGLGGRLDLASTQQADAPNNILAQEAWKSDAGGPLRQPESKFQTLFDEPTQRQIMAGLDLRSYQSLRERLASA